MTIQGPNGPKKVQLAFIRGILAAPVAVWLDENGKYFGEVSHLSYLPAGFESAANMTAMREAQEAATAAEVKAVAHAFPDGRGQGAGAVRQRPLVRCGQGRIR